MKRLLINLTRALFGLGSGALLFAVAVDALAVLGRHLGRPLLGSIELMQAALAIAAASALIAASIADRHAMVHLLMQRLSRAGRAVMRRFHAFLAILLFATFSAGSFWVAWDLRDGHERSEMLHVPFAPLRAICIATMLAITMLYTVKLWRGVRKT